MNDGAGDWLVLGCPYGGWWVGEWNLVGVGRSAVYTSLVKWVLVNFACPVA